MKYFFFGIIIFISVSANGQITFQKSFPAISTIQKTNDGGYVFSGFFYPLSDTFGDIQVLKLDSNYNVLWSSVFGKPGYDSPRKLLQNNDSTYFISGSYCCNPGYYYDFILYKIDKTGQPIWIKNYGGINQEDLYAIISNSTQHLEHNRYAIQIYLR